jgi:hypothetical protein
MMNQEKAMPRPVAHITTAVDPLEVRIKRLRIPKTRQRELLAIMDEAWANLAVGRGIRPNHPVQRKEKSASASAAR